MARKVSAVEGPVGTFRDALLARYHEGYTEGLHDMAEAVVGYLNSRSSVEDAVGDAGNACANPEPIAR